MLHAEFEIAGILQLPEHDAFFEPKASFQQNSVTTSFLAKPLLLFVPILVSACFNI